MSECVLVLYSKSSSCCSKYRVTDPRLGDIVCVGVLLTACPDYCEKCEYNANSGRAECLRCRKRSAPKKDDGTCKGEWHVRAGTDSDSYNLTDLSNTHT